MVSALSSHLARSDEYGDLYVPGHVCNSRVLLGLILARGSVHAKVAVWCPSKADGRDTTINWNGKISSVNAGPLCISSPAAMRELNFRALRLQVVIILLYLSVTILLYFRGSWSPAPGRSYRQLDHSPISEKDGSDEVKRCIEDT